MFHPEAIISRVCGTLRHMHHGNPAEDDHKISEIKTYEMRQLVKEHNIATHSDFKGWGPN
jgi:hypothetical protein